MWVDCFSTWSSREPGMNCSGDNFFPDICGGVTFHLVHGVVDVIIVTIIISCNSVVTLAIVKYNRRRKTKGISSFPNTASIRLVLSLAISDILAGLTTIYFISFDYSCAVYATLGARRIPCVARFAMFMFPASTSTFLLVVLTIDRYIAIVHPLRYREIMTRRVANRLILLTWFLGAFTGFSLFFWNNWTPTTPCQELHIVPVYYISTVCMTNLVVAATILLVLHCSIHRQALASSEIVRTMSIGNLRPSVGSSMKAKSARNIYLVLVSILVLWTPLTAIVLVRGQGVESPYLEMAYRLSISFYSLGYFINTFIYSWKNASIRTVVLQLFEQVNKRQNSANYCPPRTLLKNSCDETQDFSVVLTSLVESNSIEV